MVHMGDDKWEAQTDSNLIPKIVCRIADNFTESAYNYKLDMQQTLETYLEDIACEGIHGNSDDKDETKRVQECYKKTLEQVRLILFNVTKERMGELKAQAILQKGTKKK
jgi:hypothetical protein